MLKVLTNQNELFQSGYSALKFHTCQTVKVIPVLGARTMHNPPSIVVENYLV